MAEQSVGPKCDRQGGFGRQGEIMPAVGVGPAAVEPLEGRTFFNVTLSPGANVNVSQMQENQNEVTIAVNPTNPNQIFVSAVNDSALTGALDDPNGDLDGRSRPIIGPGEDGDDALRDLLGGQFIGVSDDGGATWTRRTLGEGDNLAAACCDGSAAYDQFGNLFFTYITDLDAGPGMVVMAVSTDNGLTFTTLKTFGGGSTELDQPTITTGNGSAWVTFRRNEEVVAAGVAVTGLGGFGTVSDPEDIPDAEGNFGDIAIGPSGEVSVAYQDPTSGEGPVTLFVNTDPDGLGPAPFGPKIEVAATNVGGFDYIPAQNQRSVDAEVGLGYDRSGGPFNGRLYMVYTDDRTLEHVDDPNGFDGGFTGGDSNSDLDIFLRYSTNQGTTWSDPIRVSDAPPGTTQFLPRMAIDQTNGNIGFIWHDTRNEEGITPKDNDEARVWGTVAVPGALGVAVAPNVQISTGVSVSERALAVIDFGDYTGLAFNNNVMYPAWADNSNSTGDNPSGGVDSTANLATLDAYTSKVTVTATAAPTDMIVLVSSPLSPDFVGKSTVTGGKNYTFKVTFKSDAPIDLSSIGGDDLFIQGPGGFNASPQLVKVKADKTGTAAQATFRIADDDGKFDRDDNGQYTVFIREASVRDTANRTNQGGVLDRFIVNSKAKPKPVRVAAVRQARQAAESVPPKALAPLFAESRVSAADLLDDKRD